jgi:hypothetical protein
MGFRKISHVILAFLFIGAGVLHFITPAPFARIVPPYLPTHLLHVYLSSLAEIVGGLGLLLPTTRQVAGWGTHCFARCRVSGQRLHASGPWSWHGSAPVGTLAAATAATLTYLIGCGGVCNSRCAVELDHYICPRQFYYPFIVHLDNA